MQTFLKRGQNNVLSQFLDIFKQKIVFFWREVPPQK